MLESLQKYIVPEERLADQRETFFCVSRFYQTTKHLKFHSWKTFDLQVKHTQTKGIKYKMTVCYVGNFVVSLLVSG